MGVPVPKGTSAPVGPASHSLVVQALTTPCQARRPASPALLAITALRTLLATVDTRVLLVSTAPEVGAWDTAPQGTDCQQEAAPSTALFCPSTLWVERPQEPGDITYSQTLASQVPSMPPSSPAPGATITQTH